MTTEPYRYASGDLHGEPDPVKYPPIPDLAMAPSPPRGRTANNFARRAIRAKTDPHWRERSAESKRLLLALDAEDERRQRGGK